ncbi:hypothetical protein [uncultured Anaerococcus sp.]|uniref:hypothetical protein n=1 Tax=uncultured Anaerococcus sp. TaxID=293428 RepID=UPI0025D3344B|nr:hypothetical protein [uncultured Anaerococcus sp.]
MNIKVIYILTACLLLGSCAKEDTGVKNKSADKSTIKVDSAKQEKISLDDSGGSDLVFENIYFDDKNLDQIMDFFKAYNVDFEKSTTRIYDLVTDADNNIYDAGVFGYDWTPQTSYEGTYVFDHRLNLITFTIDDNQAVLLYTKGEDEDVKKNTILENVRAFFYTYDQDKLYYGAATRDGKSILGKFNLKDYKNENLI